MFKVNNKNTRSTSDVERCLKYFTTFSSVFVADFEQVNVSWVITTIEHKPTSDLSLN